MHDINKLPILILAYNRYDKFQRCFDTLYRQGARNFYVSIDGPRSNKDIKIQENIIIAKIDIKMFTLRLIILK